METQVYNLKKCDDVSGRKVIRRKRCFVEQHQQNYMNKIRYYYDEVIEKFISVGNWKERREVPAQDMYDTAAKAPRLVMAEPLKSLSSTSVSWVLGGSETGSMRLSEELDGLRDIDEKLKRNWRFEGEFEEGRELELEWDGNCEFQFVQLRRGQLSCLSLCLNSTASTILHLHFPLFRSK